MFYIKNHEYDIGYATPLEWLNEMLNAYGEIGDYEDYDSAMTFVNELGEDFLNFCDKKQRGIK